MDVCRERRPHLISVPGHPDRSVRCFLFEEGGRVTMEEDILLDVRHLTKSFVGQVELLRKADLLRAGGR